ncbi:50S ribosomal protein L20 [Candidatus Microgenomates bacterium]|nr:50S ribosomal protein L20 [Candidatus Microgenomates bacterium]
MARVKRGTTSRRKHNKLLALTKGYRGSKRKLIRTAKQAALHAGAYAYHGRKRKKRDFRRLWITRISQASGTLGLPYSRLIAGLKSKKIELDRKILADLVVNDPAAFDAVIDKVRTA